MEGPVEGRRGGGKRRRAETTTPCVLVGCSKLETSWSGGSFGTTQIREMLSWQPSRAGTARSNLRFFLPSFHLDHFAHRFNQKCRTRREQFWTFFTVLFGKNEGRHNTGRSLNAPTPPKNTNTADAERVERKRTWREAKPFPLPPSLETDGLE